MPFLDKEQQREYQKNWIATRRLLFFEGKSCVKCKSTKNLELDHIDPTLKVHHAIWSWSEKRRNEEISKCQVLCEQCHKDKTIVQLMKKPNADGKFICSKCKIPKYPSEFHKHTASHHGIYPSCRSCKNAQNKLRIRL